MRSHLEIEMEKALLILDVDETLLHATEEELDYPPDFQLFKYNVYQSSASLPRVY